MFLKFLEWRELSRKYQMLLYFNKTFIDNDIIRKIGQ